jgi:sarcosine oxidase, subunit delta
MRQPRQPLRIEVAKQEMLLIRCPYCGPRAEIEFAYGGEAHIARAQSPALLSDEQWAEFLFFRSNSKGLHCERWRHTHGCARFFNAVRDTVSDRLLMTYEIGQPKPDLALLRQAFGR